MKRFLLLIVFLLGGLASSEAALGRSELVFELSTALKERDQDAVAKCFNFAEVTPPARAALLKIVDRICRWPSTFVKTSERAGNGDAFDHEGKKLHLNGDWTFQIHIYGDAQSQKGYVFPAGSVGNECLILAAVE